MERRRANPPSMHERLLKAVERAASAQASSVTLIEQQRVVRLAVQETLDRNARRKPGFGKRQRDARGRSAPG